MPYVDGPLGLSYFNTLLNDTPREKGVKNFGNFNSFRMPPNPAASLKTTFSLLYPLGKNYFHGKISELYGDNGGWHNSSTQD